METNHKHDGIDNYQIDPKDLLGFQIFRLSAAPTHKAIEGTIILVVITGSPDTYFIYTMIDKVWRGVNLPL